MESIVFSMLKKSIFSIIVFAIVSSVYAQGIETESEVLARIVPKMQAVEAKYNQNIKDTTDGKKTFQQMEADAAVIAGEMAALNFEINKASVLATPSLSMPPAMVNISGGTFTMGSPAGEPERDQTEVQHQVTLSAFLMGRYEVTQREWAEIMDGNPSKYHYPENRSLYGKDGNLPIENISWMDAIEYCNRRSRNEGLSACYTITGNANEAKVTWNRQANGYRLPTEAEWEYACRAGTTTPFNTGNTITIDQANVPGRVYNGSPMQWDESNRKPVAVGSYRPNAWGLYDMHGNVWEFCFDSIRFRDSYGAQAQTNPVVILEDDNSALSVRVIRGGGWENKFSTGYDWRSATRGTGRKGSATDMTGFRIVRNAP